MAPIPGETKIWQYITLMKRIYLIDCPGVVPPNNNDSEQDILLRGVVRVENVSNPEQYIAAVLAKCKPQHIERTYEIRGYDTPIEFLELLARKGGRLLKGGEADVDGVAKMVINDFLRGKIPWFTAPPVVEGEEKKGIEGRIGKLGEMGRKRKRESEEPSVAPSVIATETVVSENEEDEDEDDGSDADGDEGIPVEELSFEGFDEDDDDEDDDDEVARSAHLKNGDRREQSSDSDGGTLLTPALDER